MYRTYYNINIYPVEFWWILWQKRPTRRRDREKKKNQSHTTGKTARATSVQRKCKALNRTASMPQRMEQDEYIRPTQIRVLQG